MSYQIEYPVYPPFCLEQMEEPAEGSEEAYRLLSMHLLCAHVYWRKTNSIAPNHTRYQMIPRLMKLFSQEVNAHYLSLLPLDRSPEQLAECYALTGAEEEKMTLLDQLARTDFITAKRAKVPERYSILTEDGEDLVPYLYMPLLRMFMKSLEQSLMKLSVYYLPN